MKKTTFYSNQNKAIMIAEVKNGNTKAESAILAEFARLESRIRDLEKGVELLTDYADNPNYEPKEIQL